MTDSKHTPEPIDVSIEPIKLSGGRMEYWVRISRGDRAIDVRNYGGDYLNRAEYEKADLRHVLLGEPKPSLTDPKYYDKHLKGGAE